MKLLSLNEEQVPLTNNVHVWSNTLLFLIIGIFQKFLIHIKKVVREIIISCLLKYWPLSDKFNSIDWNV